MTFINSIPFFIWIIPIIPLVIFLINRKKYKLEKFGSTIFLKKLTSNYIDRLRLLDLLLLIIRILIIIIILFIAMRPKLINNIIPIDISKSKIINIILIDDSFSNKYGIIDSYQRKNIIDK